MCRLRFKYNIGRMNPMSEIPSEVSSIIKSEIEEQYNRKYSTFCEKINHEDGYMRVTTSFDGTTLTDIRLVDISVKLSHEIKEALG